MASIALSGTSASDLLRSSSNGVNGVPLRSLGRSPLVGVRPRARERLMPPVQVKAKVRKVKKHDYPWPDNPDQIDTNVKGGSLSYLSHFKPLNEKPKPVVLPFEKPLMDLQKKIIDVRKMADETGLDFSDQIISLESKYQQALKDLYTHLSPIQRLSIARHPNRPTFLDHVISITDKWVELHGDRAGYDDPAIVTGIGSMDGRSYMFIGHQKGRNTKENIKRNFGMPTPHGYRKALRMMYYADHHGLPIITFIDTPGAFADLKSEEIGQGEAIAHNLRSMFGLKVPVVTVVIGEGGSGGALAIGCANKLLMMENAVFFVASPEACAAILWKTSKASPKAAEKLKITATELCKLKIADGVIPEPLGGAHADPSWTSQQIKLALVKSMNELLEMKTPELLHHRMLKFRNLGGFMEGQPVDPAKKVNMKKKEEPIILQEEFPASDFDLQEVEKLKQKLLKPNEEDTSSEAPDLALNEMAVKLKREVDEELDEAYKSMGLKDRLVLVRKEIKKAKSSKNQVMDPKLLEEIKGLHVEFMQGLSQYPNSASLNIKLDMLKQIHEAQKISEGSKKVVSLKQEINKKIKEVMDRTDVREKMDMLKAEVSNAGISKASDLDEKSKEKIVKVKKEIESEIIKTLSSLQLDVELVASKEKASMARGLVEQPYYSELKDQLDELNRQIQEGIEDAINSTDLKKKLEALKMSVAMAGKSPDSETKSKIEAMKKEVKQSLAEAMNSPPLIEKYERLKQEIARAATYDELKEGSAGDFNGGYKQDAHKDGPRLDTSKVGINIGSINN